MERLKGFVVGAGHEAQVFKDRLDRMEENICRCSRTPSEVGEEFVSSEDEGRTELFYASARGSEYVALPIKTQFPSLFLLWLPAVLVPPLLFLSWKRSLKNQPSSVTIWTAC